MILLFALAACNNEAHQDPTYYGEAKEVIDQRCASCHNDSGIAPFPLTTYKEVSAVAALVESTVKAGTMPPWQPADDCNDYQNSFDLTEHEKHLILDFIAADLPEGDKADAPRPPESQVFLKDHSLPLPLPYTPVTEPDDYRCQILDWQPEEELFITGVDITPGNPAVAHHAVAFILDGSMREDYEMWDAEQEGPGYACFGGPAGDGSSFLDTEGMSFDEIVEMMESDDFEGAGFTWLGAWVPGAIPSVFPEGTGIHMDTDDFIVLQMHYNTQASDPAPDQSVLNISVAEEVERPAITLPFTDPFWVLDMIPMHIPAGQVTTHRFADGGENSLMLHRLREGFELAPEEPLIIHSATLHMHTLGQAAELEIQRPDGDECLLKIDDWDFNWQNAYWLSQPAELYAEDSLAVSCTWDNVGDTDVKWGEGTGDEMCLGALYLTAP